MKLLKDMSCDPEKVRLPDIVKSVVLRVMRSRVLSNLLAKVCSTQVFLIRGNMKGSHSSLVTLLFGDEKIAHYFSKLVYSSDPTIKTLGETSYDRIPSKTAFTDVDILIVHTHAIFSGFLSRKGFLTLPVIRQVMDISGSWDNFFSGLSRGRRRDINEIEKLGYTYEITDEPKRFSFFYHKMYLPHTLKRHSESAKPSTFCELKKCFRNGGLLFVKLRGECVSGLLYNTYNSVMQNICSGTYEARDEYYSKNAVQAARYFLIQWSKQQGYEEIDHGLSNPFMKDGVFSYKREWGMKVKLNNDVIRSSVFALQLCNFGKGVRDFLADNPFIFTNLKSLNGLVFFNSEKPSEGKLKNVYRLYHTRGLSNLVVISYLTNEGSSSVFKVTPEGRILEELPLTKCASNLDFLTKLAPNMGFNIYLIEAHKK